MKRSVAFQGELGAFSQVAQVKCPDPWIFEITSRLFAGGTRTIRPG